MPLLKEVIRINEAQPMRMIGLLKSRIPSLEGVPVAVLGLAFKPDTDDLRESPALRVIDLLLQEGARVLAYDPVAMPAAQKALADRPVVYCESLEQAVRKAKALLLVTSWKEFERLASAHDPPSPPPRAGGRPSPAPPRERQELPRHRALKRP